MIGTRLTRRQAPPHPAGPWASCRHRLVSSSWQRKLTTSCLQRHTAHLDVAQGARAHGAAGAGPAPCLPGFKTRRLQRQHLVTAGYGDSAGLPASARAQEQSWRGAVHSLATHLYQAVVSTAAVQFLIQYRAVVGRVLATLLLIAVIRLGLYIPLPGIDFSSMPAVAPLSEGERLMRALYGQAHALPTSLFELGISPHMNAAIAISFVLCMPDLPTGWGPLQRLREARREGRSGQAYIEGYINSFSLVLAIYFGLLKALELQPYALLGAGGSSFLPLTALTLVAGACITQHCAALITTAGVGNGPSLVIAAGIVTVAGYLVLALAAVYILRSSLRLPIVQYNRSISTSQPEFRHNPEGIPSGGEAGSRTRTRPLEEGDTGFGMQPSGDVGTGSPQMDPGLKLFAQSRAVVEQKLLARSTRADFFPLPINSNGMMSVILASVIWFHGLPAMADFCGLTSLRAAVTAVQMTWAGQLVYGVLVALLEFLPLGGINPKEVADYFGALNVGVRGVVPGEATETHLAAHLLRCKFWGGIAMGTLAVVASVYDLACMQRLGASLSATSLLIIVGTVMQSSKQVEGLLEAPRLATQLKREQEQVRALRAL